MSQHTTTADGVIDWKPIAAQVLAGVAQLPDPRHSTPLGDKIIHFIGCDLIEKNQFGFCTPFLDQGPTVKQISQALDQTPRSIAGAISSLVRLGYVHRIDDGCLCPGLTYWGWRQHRAYLSLLPNLLSNWEFLFDWDSEPESEVVRQVEAEGINILTLEPRTSSLAPSEAFAGPTLDLEERWAVTTELAIYMLEKTPNEVEQFRKQFTVPDSRQGTEEQDEFACPKCGKQMDVYSPLNVSALWCHGSRLFQLEGFNAYGSLGRCFPDNARNSIFMAKFSAATREYRQVNREDEVQE